MITSRLGIFVPCGRHGRSLQHILRAYPATKHIELQSLISTIETPQSQAACQHTVRVHNGGPNDFRVAIRRVCARSRPGTREALPTPVSQALSVLSSARPLGSRKLTVLDFVFCTSRDDLDVNFVLLCSSAVPRSVARLPCSARHFVLELRFSPPVALSELGPRPCRDPKTAPS